MPWMPTPEQRAAISAAISAAQKRSWAERRAERIAAIAAGIAAKSAANKQREADAGASGRATPDAADQHTTSGGVESRHAATGTSAVGPDGLRAGAAMSMTSATPSPGPEDAAIAGVAPGPLTSTDDGKPCDV